jgi:IclR family transcriptional regulator, mhp operon transcriptional activator
MLDSGQRNAACDLMSDPNIVKGLERGLLVLQALQIRQDCSLHDLHSVTRISKPSLLRILHTLMQAGLVTRRLADGRYRIGSNLPDATTRRARRDRIAEAAAPVLERLCQRASWPSDLMVPAGDHMEIRETSRSRSPFLLQPERIGWRVNWLLTAVGRVYLAFCPTKERQSVINLLRSSAKMEDRLAREPERLNAILAETRARGYGTRDAIHIGGHYGVPPHADGLLAIAVPLLDGAKVYGAINMLWLRPAFSVEAFAARHLSDLQTAAAEIVSSLRRRTRA